jgi:hypothetical protein
MVSELHQKVSFFLFFNGTSGLLEMRGFPSDDGTPGPALPSFREYFNIQPDNQTVDSFGIWHTANALYILDDGYLP